MASRFETTFDASDARFRAKHVLFVEGIKGSIDFRVLDALFNKRVQIEPLGSSYYIKGAAEALSKYHPNYYFLIDRDHHDDAFVQKCWDNFPNPDTHNLLVWKRREIENYFIDPDYIVQSEYCIVDEDALKAKILAFSRARVFMDVANYVVISIREEQKKNWIKQFKNVDSFGSKEDALEQLRNASEFESRKTEVAEMVSYSEVEQRFHDTLDVMTGGKNVIEFGHGDWLHMIQGKAIFSQVINSGGFSVPNDKIGVGQDKIGLIVENLLREVDLPDDFLALKTLIHERIRSAS